MKICNLIFIIILQAITQSYSQQGWYPINFLTDKPDYKSVVFNSASKGFAVTEQGTVSYTSDGGIHWVEKMISSYPLNDIFFISEIGFIAGDRGKIFKTSGSNIWEEKFSGTHNKLRAVFFVNVDTGYVFGDSSTILKTIDGGESWNALNVQSNLTITDGAFPSPDFGFCTNLEGILMRTTDYGLTWEYNPNYYGIHYSVFFTDDSYGYITASGYDIGYVLSTTDRGDTFEVLWLNDVADPVISSYFIDSETGFIITSSSILKTTDAGNTWKKLFIPINDKAFTSVFFTDVLNGYLAGEDSIFMRTTDGGNTWSFNGSGHTSRLKSVHFPTADYGFTVGDNGVVYKIENEKVSLIYREEYIYNALNSIYFLDTIRGFIGGEVGSFFRTTDGGSSWLRDNYNGNYAFHSIDFYDSQCGIVSGGEVLLKTTDGGDTWNLQNSQTSTADIFFLSQDTILSVGFSGKIFKSYDKGLTWVEKNSGISSSLYSVDFINDSIGFAVGYMGNYVVTTDKGETWALHNLGTNEHLTQVYFINDLKGFIIGTDGIKFATSDGGKNWTAQHYNTEEDLFDIVFTNDSIGYIVGSYGLMLKTENGGVVSVEPYEPLPSNYLLKQNYPNPFNPVTTLPFSIPLPAQIKLKVYDILGNEVAILVNEEKPAGEYQVQWNASAYSSGVYFYRLSAGDRTEIKKMMFLK